MPGLGFASTLFQTAGAVTGNEKLKQAGAVTRGLSNRQFSVPVGDQGGQFRVSWSGGKKAPLKGFNNQGKSWWQAPSLQSRDWRTMEDLSVGRGKQSPRRINLRYGVPGQKPEAPTPTTPPTAEDGGGGSGPFARFQAPTMPGSEDIGPITYGRSASTWPEMGSPSAELANRYPGAIETTGIEALPPGRTAMFALGMGKDPGPGKRKAGMSDRARLRIRQDLADV